MKTNKPKKEINKFDLEKFSVAKLKNLKSINGGGDVNPAGGDETITDILNNNNDRKV